MFIVFLCAVEDLDIHNVAHGGIGPSNHGRVTVSEIIFLQSSSRMNFEQKLDAKSRGRSFPYFHM